MSFVSMLAIGLLIAFGSSLINLKDRYDMFLNEYGYVDEQISTDLEERETLKALKDNVQGIDTLDIRFSLDTYLKKSESPTEKTLTARIFSYNEEENKVFKRYVLSKTEPNYEKDEGDYYKYINASVARKFASNNNINLGDTLVIGYFDVYVKIFVSEIVDTTEGIYPRANEYIWSDNQGFGYLYVNEAEMGKGVTNLANGIINRINKESTDEAKQAMRKLFEGVIDLLGLPNFLDPNIDPNYVTKYGNQILIRNQKGYYQDAVMADCLAYLKNSSVTVNSSLTGAQLPYRIYMKNAQRQLTIASIFLPVFFYSVTMIIIGLFMNQIIKNMTSDIGIMMSIGVGSWDIVSVFILFASIIGITSGVLGIGVGYGINALLVKIMINTYSIPILTFAIHPWVSSCAVIALVLFAEVATLLSCLAIFKISPKDAVISNEAKRKKNPEWVNKIIDKSPMNIKLGLNSIFQNPKRFFVSTFSIFASFVLIMLCCNFYISKEAMIGQSVNSRLNYDCQVYMREVSNQEDIDAIKNLDSVSNFEDCYYTFLKVENGSKSTYIEALAIDEKSNAGLVIIPNEKGSGQLQIPESGLIVPKSCADELNIKKGDQVRVGTSYVKVEAISYQYFHPICYLSKNQMKTFKDNSADITYVSSFLVDVNNAEEFENYFTTNSVQCLTVYTKNLSKDLKGIFDAVNIMIYIMIGFAFGIGFIILLIMSQNTLMEQTRSVSVLRLIGFTIGDVSRFWSLQSILQILVSMIFAIPAGIGASILLFTLASSSSQIYPFIFSWPVLGISFGFIVLTVLICHSISMISVRNWNLANNTRSRE